jgi:protease I
VYKGKHGYPCTSDVSWKDLHSKDFLALCIPGGYAPDKLRTEPKVLELTRSFNEEHKMIAFICHAGWVPISAKIVKGKKVTSVDAIKDDLENAGAIWKNEPFVVDGNLVSGRVVADIPHFAKAIINYLGK